MSHKKDATKDVDRSALTPMMRQYYEIKDQLDHTILFFRMGDFYEIFGEDALEVAPKLNIVLTAREKGKGDKIPFCGVPHHSARNYWLKLIRMGYKVAIADQLESPKDVKGIVKRGVVKTITPGCIDDLEGLEGDAANYIMAVYQDPKSRVWSGALCDVSTGEIKAGSFDNFEQIRELVYEFRPKELLTRSIFKEKLESLLASYKVDHLLIVGALSEANLRNEIQQKKIFRECFGQENSPNLSCKSFEGDIPLISSLLSHIKSLGIGLEAFLDVLPLFSSDYLQLDETARRDLELFETSRRRELKGSLFFEINRTLTPMGARALRECLSRPYANKNLIEKRQNAVNIFCKEEKESFFKLRSLMKGVIDLQRYSAKIYSGQIQPKNLAKIRDSLLKIKEIYEILNKKLQNNLKVVYPHLFLELSEYKTSLDLLENSLVEFPSNMSEDLEVFKKGYDAFLDEKVTLSRSGEEAIKGYESNLRDQTGIQSLKIKSHKTFGLVIEITKSNLEKVPKEFHRRQTMVNCERFQTSELNDLAEQLDSAFTVACEKEESLFKDLLKKLSLQRKSFYYLSSSLSELDVILSLAQKALESSFTKPNITLEDKLILKGAKHPVVESFVGVDQFVANDIELKKGQKHLLITGPNMAGKSTLMRQTAICVVLNQIGGFVPCAEAVLPIFNRIFTRVGASDDLSRGQSTFMVEMIEAAQIVRKADKKSLVILDEVGRGTSTEDGLAIATALLEEIAYRVQCFTLFATHYHEIVEISETFPDVFPVSTEVIKSENNIKFTHRLVAGASGNSYGIEVAKLAGMPASVLNKASKYLEKISHLPKAGATKKVDTPLKTAPLKTELPKNSRILEKIEELNINKMTPLKALTFLNDLKLELKNPEKSNAIFDDLFS